MPLARRVPSSRYFFWTSSQHLHRPQSVVSWWRRKNVSWLLERILHLMITYSGNESGTEQYILLLISLLVTIRLNYFNQGERSMYSSQVTIVRFKPGSGHGIAPQKNAAALWFLSPCIWIVAIGWSWTFRWWHKGVQLWAGHIFQ